MRKKLLLLFLPITIGSFAQFTPNNLAVSKITSPTAITNAGFGFQTNIVEFTTAGVATATNINLTGSGTDFVIEERAVTHEGQLNLSIDKTFLVMCGYNSAVGTIATGPVSLRNADKIIARVDGSGNIDMSTRILAASGTFNSQSVRSVISQDGSSYIINSSNNGLTQGTRKIDHGTETSTFFNNSGNSGHRSISFLGDKVIATTQLPSQVWSINDAGVGTQVAFPATLEGMNYTQIQFFDMDPAVSWDGSGYDLMYVADRSAGIRKFFFDGTLWAPVSATGAFNPASLQGTGVWALTGRLEDGKPTIYAVKILIAGGAYTSSSLVKVVDNAQRTEDWNATATELTVTGNTEMFRGVAFTPGSDVVVLPIKLQAFTGSLNKDIAILKWTTSSEINAKEFQIEQSTNGLNFRNVGSVSALNRIGGASYSYDDNGLVSGNNYYRLKLVDKDGQSAYSKVIVINKGENSGLQVAVYPNPTTAVINITHPLVEQKTTLLISDLSGRVIMEKELGFGTKQSTINVSSFTKGQYNIIITNAKGRMVSKFIK